MPFFARIRPEETPAPAAPVLRLERRSVERFSVHPGFPVKTVISFIGRDDTGAPMGHSRQGWNWKCRLVDCSGEGARVQLGHGVRAEVGDPCDLMLTLEELDLTIPSRIANLNETADGTILGLRHAIAEETVWNGYRRLLEAIAFGSTLQPRLRRTQPDRFGYLLEQYASDWGSHLNVWRQPEDTVMIAFEFLLEDGIVRAASGQKIEYRTVLAGAGSRPAPPVEAGRLHRLFGWVVPNLAPAVPADVQAFLRYYAG